MYRLMIGLCFLAVTLLLSTSVSQLTAEEKKDDTKGWTQLFNGKDLTGWKLPDNPNPGAFSAVIAKEKDGKVVAYYGKLKKDEKEVPLWRAEDGLLIGSGPSSHLFSERGDYENFHFRVEAMINDHG